MLGGILVWKEDRSSRAARIPLFWLNTPPAQERQNWGLSCRVLAKLLSKQIEIEEFCNGAV